MEMPETSTLRSEPMGVRLEKGGFNSEGGGACCIKIGKKSRNRILELAQKRLYYLRQHMV